MKKIIFHTIIFGYIAISQTAFSETVYKHNQVQLKKGSNLVYDLNNKPFNGILEYIPSIDKNYKISQMLDQELRYGINYNDSTKIRVTFKNGRKDGKWQKYEDDILIEEFTFQNGSLNGTYTEFDRSRIGEIRAQKEFINNQCVQYTRFQSGKARFAIKMTDKIEKSAKETKCEWQYFTKITYNSAGKIIKENNNKAKTIKWYNQDGTLSAYKEPAPEKIKNLADSLLSVYYEKDKPMLNLLLKDKKSTGGELYDKNGTRKRLEAEEATEYLMDFILSQSLGGL